MYDCRVSTPPRPDNLRFPRSHRLTGSSELRAMVREGKRFRTEHLDLRGAASPVSHPRVGFIVPKHKQSSVARNRLKRRLREIVRVDVLPQLPSIDLVIRARPEAYGASMLALREEVIRGATRLASLGREK
ncbi:MAG: ribonuclease P protein component [Gemmatimonadaceae bacterium]